MGIVIGLLVAVCLILVVAVGVLFYEIRMIRSCKDKKMWSVLTRSNTKQYMPFQSLYNLIDWSRQDVGHIFLRLKLLEKQLGVEYVACPRQENYEYKKIKKGGKS